MTGKNIAISQRESFTPSRFTLLLWWLATAEKEILIDSVVDRNRYRIIGMTVLGTWAFAVFTWTYFFNTVTSSLLLAILLGMFMGFIILTIDRALIKGITKFNKRKFTPLLFRGMLAITIGTFMAQPAVLYMFDKEIRLQTSLDNEKRKLKKRAEMDALYLGQKNELFQIKDQTKKELESQFKLVQTARQDFLAETDGSGGSGKIGLKEIATAKRNEYQKLDELFQSMLKKGQPKIDSVDAGLAAIEQKIRKEEANFELFLNDGFLTRVEALSHVLQSNPALQFRYYLIIIILMLIELMPVIAKTLLPSGSYDEKVMLREQMEIQIANINARREQDLKEFYNQMAFESDKAAITAFFAISKEQRDEKIKNFSKNWMEEEQQTFDGTWERLKQEVLSKQEN